MSIAEKHNEPVTCDLEASIEFLTEFYGPGVAWGLVAISPNVANLIIAYTIPPGPNQAKAARSWIKHQNDVMRHNVYFTPYRLHKLLHKKATKEDVAAVEHVRVDIDPSDGVDPEALADSQPDSVPPATWKVFSGRGYWLYWKLMQLMAADGPGGEATLQIEAVNRGLERAYGADNVFNVDRIARLPGTINHKTGQLAQVIEYHPDRVYQLKDFPSLQVPPKQAPKIALATEHGDLVADLPDWIHTYVSTGAGLSDNPNDYPGGIIPDDEEAIAAVLAAIPPGLSRPYWMNVLWGVKSHCDEGVAYELIKKWSAGSKEKFNAKQPFDAVWASLGEPRSTILTVTYYARLARAGWDGLTQPELFEKQLEAGGKDPGQGTTDNQTRVESRNEPSEYEQTLSPGVIEDILFAAIRETRPKGARKQVWFVINEMLRRGYLTKTIIDSILDPKNGCSASVLDQSNPMAYAQKLVSDALVKLELEMGEKGPLLTLSNINVAMLKLGIVVRYNEFSHEVEINGLKGMGPRFEDAELDRLSITMDRLLHFKPKDTLLLKVVRDTARLNKYHPVRDYLASLKWDGVERLDAWLVTYGRAEDNEYTRAVGAISLIAAVRRVRQPGCKYDEMLVFRSDQGMDKSTAIQTLARRLEWYTDNLPLNVRSKELMEITGGKWIVEIPDLAGMKRAEINQVKAMQSRSHDKARLAFDRLPSEVPRQYICIGTTNDIKFLKDLTGNRRWWPVECGTFDIEALKRDIDQIWAEAAAREAADESIRLAKALWPRAAEEQARRTTDDPYKLQLQHYLADYSEGSWKITTADLWTILQLRAGQRNQDHQARLGAAMRALGWEQNKAGTIKRDKVSISGWFRGDEKKRKELGVIQLDNGSLVVSERVM